jgi:uncharacterized protein (DUF2235 family)
MKKRIVIACDGTWNRLDARWPTNVVKAAQAILPAAPDGTVQIVYHLDGVGTGRGTGFLARRWDRIAGGAFGEGLDRRLEEAYRVLVFNYTPGDELYFIGFSRGAFMARSLAGLTRCAGIVMRQAATAIPQALALYTRRDPKGRKSTDEPKPGEPPVVGPDDAVARSFRENYAHADEPPPIAYIGVWDTVGSLGIPDQILLAKVLNRGLGFHDLELSRRVGAARHAVSIDERRRNFLPSLWKNLDRLNADAGHRRYLQAWFPGDHGAVGGGSDDSRLSDAAALWVLEGAEAAGLALDPVAVARLRSGCDCTGRLLDPDPGLVTRIMRRFAVDRSGPDDLADVSIPARDRWVVDPAYRPKPLARLAEALDQPTP